MLNPLVTFFQKVTYAEPPHTGHLISPPKSKFTAVFLQVPLLEVQKRRTEGPFDTEFKPKARLRIFLATDAQVAKLRRPGQGRGERTQISEAASRPGGELSVSPFVLLVQEAQLFSGTNYFSPVFFGWLPHQKWSSPKRVPFFCRVAEQLDIPLGQTSKELSFGGAMFPRFCLASTQGAIERAFDLWLLCSCQVLQKKERGANPRKRKHNMCLLLPFLIESTSDASFRAMFVFVSSGWLGVSFVLFCFWSTQQHF